MSSIFIGQVKSYNSRKGYGFIETIGSRDSSSFQVNEDEEKKTYFVHSTSILTDQSFPVKKLYTGEYVEFNIRVSDVSGELQAVNVSGLFEGKLLCDHGMFRFRKLNWASSSAPKEISEPEETVSVEDEI